MGGGGSKPAGEDRSRKKHRRSSSHGGSSSSLGRRYGSFAEEHATFVWESQVTPWRLFLLSVVAMLKNVAGLMMLYWVLISQKEYLMACDTRKHPFSVVLGCEYTKAFLRGFPLLGASISIVVAMRVMLQQRVFYGLLKLGGLLDFKNVDAYKDPIMWLLGMSLLHGMGHFGLKLYYQEVEHLSELQMISQKFMVPAFIFMAFFYTSYDVEKTLIPLSKYVEEDCEYAKRTLGHIHFLQEDVVREEVMTTDMVSHASHPRIKEVYKAIISRYHRVSEGFEAKSKFCCCCEFRLFHAMWPATILMDSRLTDNDSISYRRMFLCFAFLACIIQLLIFVAFGYQVYHDIWIDVYHEHEYEDMGSFFVMLFHLCMVFWLLSVSLHVAFSQCFARRKQHHSVHNH